MWPCGSKSTSKLKFEDISVLPQVRTKAASIAGYATIILVLFFLLVEILCIVSFALSFALSFAVYSFIRCHFQTNILHLLSSTSYTKRTEDFYFIEPLLFWDKYLKKQNTSKDTAKDTIHKISSIIPFLRLSLTSNGLWKKAKNCKRNNGRLGKKRKNYFIPKNLATGLLPQSLNGGHSS